MSEPARFSDYLALTKPRLSLLSVLTTLAAYTAVRISHEPLRLLWVFVGTSLAAAGAATLNQWLEVDTDSRMDRTAGRPIPSGRVPSGSAFVLGSLLCVASLMVLFAAVNPLSALFTLLTVVAYLGCYTPAKRRSRWSTEIGAVAGALPPLIGWAAGEGRISALGWILFGILYFWQMPHFMAIAWMYREDYTAVQFPMASVRDPSGKWVAIWAFANCLFLAAVSLLPLWLRLDTWAYGAAVAAADVWLLFRGISFLRAGTRDAAARKLFFATILYLPWILIALVADRIAFY